MRYRLLDILVCPACRGELDLESSKTVHTELSEDFVPRECASRCAYHEHGGDLRDCRACYAHTIEEGRLKCRDCEEGFEIRAGVPRLVAASWVDGSPEETDLRETQRRFAYAWRHFGRREVADGWVKDSYHYYSHFPEVVEGARTGLALDVGCGSGADLLRFAHEGGEVVGIDLTETVEVAHRNTSHVPTIHLAQANLYRLPFRPATFQVVYAFGVLHHLPDPQGGFRRLVEMARHGGWVLIYVYEDFSDRSAVERGLLKGVGVLRQATKRLSPRLLHGLSIAGLPLIYLGCTLPYQLLRRFNRTRSLAGRIPYRHTMNPATLVSDLYDRFATPIEERYSLEEIVGWFRSAGFPEPKGINYRGWVAWAVKGGENNP